MNDKVDAERHDECMEMMRTVQMNAWMLGEGIDSPWVQKEMVASLWQSEWKSFGT